MKQITYGSVCSGIEAASVAWHPLGWRAAWLAEIEPAPSKILAYHYPDVPNLGDMTMLPTYVRMRLIAAPDILVGGTPCQAYSIAGMRAGLSDPRGQLTLKFVELADAIDEQRPVDDECIVVWENVPGVLSSKDNAFGYFLAGLAGEDDALVAPGGKWANAGVVLGPKRAVAWRILDAQYFGVAQRRRRVFVVASARKDFDPAAVLFEFDGVRRHTAPRREAREETAGTLAPRTGAGGFPGTDEACSGYLQPVKTVDVCPTLRAGGNSTGGDRPPGTDVDTADSLIAYSVALRGRDGGATAELGDDLAGCLRASGGNRTSGPIAFDSRQDCVSSTEVFGALGSSSPQAQAVSYAIQAGALRTNPLSGPDGVGVQAHIAYTLEARAEVQAVATAGALCAHTYSGGASGRPDMAMQGYFQPVGMAVRRLTPMECERLQAFPDKYTAIPGMKDGPRYKALGNSKCVFVVRWLGIRMIMTHPHLFC